MMHGQKNIKSPTLYVHYSCVKW